jgi:hypothetical protein
MTAPACRLADAIALLHRHGADWHVPLFRAARDGLIQLRLVQPGQRVPVRDTDPATCRAPTVVLLNGDACDGRHRPADFPQAVRWLRWSRAIMLHGTGGKPEHYIAAVTAARIVNRVLIVDLPSIALPEWHALAQRVAPRASGLIITPLPGGAHPTAERTH